MRRPLALVLLALLPLLAAAAPLRAQLLDVVPGTRVRLTAPGVLATRFEGTVLRRTSDSLTVASGGGEQLTVPVAGITALELNRGRSHGRGAVRGALWGF